MGQLKAGILPYIVIYKKIDDRRGAFLLFMYAQCAQKTIS